MLGAILGSSHAGEQTLLKRLVKRRPDLFAGRVTCFDRNFRGHELITAILDAGGHVIARVSATVALPLGEGGGWLPDGSRLTWLNAPSGKKAGGLPVRVAEHNAIMRYTPERLKHLKISPWRWTAGPCQDTCMSPFAARLITGTVAADAGTELAKSGGQACARARVPAIAVMRFIILPPLGMDRMVPAAARHTRAVTAIIRD
jgi:hypothetical protein